jgi:glycosyltransferase involved in cell wall biosynthesis
VATNRLPSRAPDDSLRLSARQNFSDDSASIPATAVLRRHLEPMAITCRSLRARGARRLSACAEMRGRARSARYDVAIYAPGSAQVYVEGAAAAGGAERQMMLLARELARRGLRVCHVVEHVDAVDTDQDGVRLVIQRPEVPRMLPGGMIGRTWDALKRADAEIYLQRSVGFATFLVGAFARLHRRGFIYSASSSLDLAYRVPASKVEMAGFRLGLPLADIVVVQSHEQAANAPRRPPVVRIPSFCEPQPQSDEPRDLFLWVGRPAPYKNPIAFAELARDVPDAQFVMVGVEASSLETTSELPPNLTVIPPLPRSELSPYYRRAIAVVNTSEFEGFPNTFMEGWAHGALALSLNVDPDDVIPQHGLGKVAHGSHAALVSAAKAMWSSRDRLAAARGRAVHYVSEHHAPKFVGERWYELIEELRSRRSSARAAPTTVEATAESQTR